MLILPFSPIALFTLLSSLATPSSTATTPSPSQRVLLSSIKSLTLRKDQRTTAHRAAPIPQLTCVGGSAHALYEIDTLRCRNAGSGYGDDDVQWTCTASLPAEFKLGSTDVLCEGFASPDDPYILKGSCGVEYRLVLTELGEEKYGRRKGGEGGVWDGLDGFPKSKAGDWATVLFWLAFVGVLVWILWAIFVRDGGVRRAGGGAAGGGWGPGGGGGGGGGDGYDDPPPPYDYRPPPSKPRASASTYTRPARPAAARPQQQQQQQGWRPGFWTGALGGAAAGYMAGGRRNQTQEQPRNNPGYSWGGNGEGSSGWGAPRSSASSSSSSNSGYGSARHESSGFGGTTRR